MTEQASLALGRTRTQPTAVTRRNRRTTWGATLQHVVLVALALCTLFPVILVISTAFKSSADVRTDPFGLFTSFSWENLTSAWTQGRFSEYLANSLLLTVPSTLVIIVLSTMAGYAFARLPFRGRSAFFSIIVLALLVPFFTYMIPLYFQLRQMGLLDTLTGAVLVLAMTGLSFGTFFMRAFFLDLPSELEQSARVDGCGEFQIFVRIMLPLVRPGIGALTVFTFLTNWNNFLVPLLYLPSGSYRPLTAGLYLFTGGRTTDIGPLAAGTLITILPVLIVFLALQRQVTQGFLSGAVKG